MENSDNKEIQENQENKETQDNSSSSKYKEGQLITFIKIRFPGNAKCFPFATGRRDYYYGQKVVAMSDRGMAVGYVNSFPYEEKFVKTMLPIKYISKVATDDDLKKQFEHYQKEKEYEITCKESIERLKLGMELTHVEFTQFGKKVIFYFTAPARVDFRELVKELVGKLKMRIELRQISVRDRAAALGGLGQCGRQLCCSCFLNRYGNTNIKLAKNQNLTLSPAKLNGVCGQLKCCLKYEDNVYSDKRKQLPKEGTFIQTINGDQGKILRLHILIEQFEMLTDRGVIRKYDISQYDAKRKLPEDWKFPDRFQHISNETSDVVGKNKE